MSRVTDGLPLVPAFFPATSAERSPNASAPRSGTYLPAARSAASFIRAAGRQAIESDPAGLAELLALSDVLDSAVSEAVAGLRAAGFSWAEIGAGVGITRQTAHERWGAGS